MKAIDIIGLQNVELKEFQHKAELQLEKHSEGIDKKMDCKDYDKDIRELQEMFEKKLERGLAELEIKVNRNKKFGDERIDKLLE